MQRKGLLWLQLKSSRIACQGNIIVFTAQYL